jgi:hypothetical protein
MRSAGETLTLQAKRPKKAKKNRGGKALKLAVEDKLYITLQYLREYRTDSIAAEYGVCKGTVCLAIQWVEDTWTAGVHSPCRGKRHSGKIGLNSVYHCRCNRKPDKPRQKEPKRVLLVSYR